MSLVDVKLPAWHGHLPVCLTCARSTPARQILSDGSCAVCRWRVSGLRAAAKLQQRCTCVLGGQSLHAPWQALPVLPLRALLEQLREWAQPVSQSGQLCMVQGTRSQQND